MGLAQRTGAARVRTGSKDAALRTARVCYDHLAGERGVALMDGLVAQGWITAGTEPAVTAAGRQRLTALAIDVTALERNRRPVCRACLDWSERRSHLAGALGAVILDRIVAKAWASRAEGRVVRFSGTGSQAFAAAFGLVGAA